MFHSSRPVWHLPVALCAVVFVLDVLIGIRCREWIVFNGKARGPDVLYNIFSPATIHALYKDAQLHNSLISFTEAVAETTERMGLVYGMEGFRSFSRNLTVEIGRMQKHPSHKKTKRRKRQLFDSVQGELKETLGDKNNTGSLEALFAQAFSSLGGSITSDLATPALFLGIGLGMGAETGLNLTDPSTSLAMASSIAAANNAMPTGLNMIAQNLGRGLGQQMSPSLQFLPTGNQIGMAAYAMAQGMGRGSAMGFNLTSTTYGPSTGTDLMAVAGNLGLGFSRPLAENVDVMQFLGQAGNTGAQFMAQLPEIAVAAGQGLGMGASAGLGLSKKGTQPQKRQTNGNNRINIPGTVEDFTRGLSQSFIQSSNLTQAFNMVVPGGTSGFGNFDIMAMIVPIASGAGKGIGEGAAIGLGLKQDIGMRLTSANMTGDEETEMITEQFAKNLMSSFLSNGTSLAVIGNLMASSSGFTANLKPAQIAEGLARGLVDGGIGAVAGVGGIENLISGNFSMEMAMAAPPMAITYNDSVNGSAVAFGRGLAGEGALLLAGLFSNSTKAKASNGTMIMPRSAKRGLDVKDMAVGKQPDLFETLYMLTTPVPPITLARRQDITVPPDLLSFLAQRGTTALTCQGVGGLIGVVLGLQKSMEQGSDKKSPAMIDSTLALLPKDPITISSEGNTFKINVRERTAIVNGVPFLPFAILTGVHILLCTLAFFFFLPIYLALGALLRLSVLIGSPLNAATNKKWRRIILFGLFTPTAIAGPVLGVVGRGSSAHFQTTHGILGLVTFILLIPALIISTLRLRSTREPSPTAFVPKFRNVIDAFKGPGKIFAYYSLIHQVFLQVATVAWIQGWSDLRAITLCITDTILTASSIVGVINGLLFVQIGAMSIIGLRMWMEGRVAASNSSASLAGSQDSEKGIKRKSLKHKLKRSDTINTFGFDTDPTVQMPTIPASTATSTGSNVTNNVTPVPFVIKNLSSKPFLPPIDRRLTDELRGSEDGGIGYLTNVRKLDDDDIPPAPSNGLNPFISPFDDPKDLYKPTLASSHTRTGATSIPRNISHQAETRTSSPLTPLPLNPKPNPNKTIKPNSNSVPNSNMKTTSNPTDPITPTNKSPTTTDAYPDTPFDDTAYPYPYPTNTNQRFTTYHLGTDIFTPTTVANGRPSSDIEPFQLASLLSGNAGQGQNGGGSGYIGGESVPPLPLQRFLGLEKSEEGLGLGGYGGYEGMGPGGRI